MLSYLQAAPGGNLFAVTGYEALQRAAGRCRGIEDEVPREEPRAGKMRPVVTFCSSTSKFVKVADDSVAP
jgi:hypothetical protein